MTVERKPSLATCWECQRSSPLVDLFSRKGGHLLCPRCAHEKSVRSEALGCLVALIAVPGLLLFYYVASSGFATFGYLTVNFLLVVGWWIVFLLLHELAHVTAAWPTGGRVFAVHLGFGNPRLRRRVGNIDLVVNPVPVAGMVFLAFPSRRAIVARHAVATAAGPLLHVVMLALLIPAFDFEKLGTSVAWVEALALVNAIMLAISLFPSNPRMGALALPSDGLKLLQLAAGRYSPTELHSTYYLLASGAAFERREFDHTVEVSRQGLAAYPDNPLLRVNLVAGLISLEQYDQAWQVSEEVLAMGDELPPPILAMAMNNAAWLALLRNPAGASLEQAQQRASQAYRLLPWVAVVEGTLGAVLVECGDFQDGIAHLQSAARHQTSPEDSASNLAYVAMAHHRLGERDRAGKTLQEAIELDPEGLIVKRAQREIETSPPSQQIPPLANLPEASHG